MQTTNGKPQFPESVRNDGPKPSAVPESGALGFQPAGPSEIPAAQGSPDKCPASVRNPETDQQATDSALPRRPSGGAREGSGRKPEHGFYAISRALALVGIRGLDPESPAGIAAREWIEDVTADLGGDLTRSQMTLVEMSARTWLLSRSTAFNASTSSRTSRRAGALS